MDKGFSEQGPREAILLVAGTGSRLHPYTRECPKCLLEVGELTLLERLLGHLEALGIERVVLATGFMNEHLVSRARAFGRGIEIAEAYCPSFEDENNAVSLLAGMKALRGRSFLLCDGDILLKSAVGMEALLSRREENVLSVIRFEEMGAEEMKVQLDEAGQVAFLSKGILPEQADGESLGIQKIGPTVFDALLGRLEALSAEERIKLYYEDVFAELIEEGAPFYITEFPEDSWTEIDTAEDLELARSMARRWGL